MARLFGTDGVRGVAGRELTASLAMEVGAAAAMVLAAETNKKPLVIIGRDTRASGDLLEAAAAAGLCAVGADVLLLGVVPTPAVAYLVQRYRADAGVMLSASHNPYEFNGIKLFGPKGFKLTDAEEDRIEELVRSGRALDGQKSGGAVGRISRAQSAAEDYTDVYKRQVMVMPFQMQSILPELSSSSLESQSIGWNSTSTPRREATSLARSMSKPTISFFSSR